MTVQSGTGKVQGGKALYRAHFALVQWYMSVQVGMYWYKLSCQLLFIPVHLCHHDALLMNLLL